MSIFSNPAIKFPWFVENVAGKPRGLLLAFIPIPLIGLILELSGIHNAFNKSGAVLVCVAIFCVYTNHFLSKEIEYTKSARDAASKLGDTEEKIYANLNQTIQGEQRGQLAKNLYSLLTQAKEELPKLNTTNENIVKLEFMAGIVGTLIWGFGDLIQCLTRL